MNADAESIPMDISPAPSPIRHRTYTTYSKEAYALLIDAARSGYDLETCAWRANIKVPAARRILERHFRDTSYRAPLKRGGPRNIKYDRKEIVPRMIAILEQQPTLTLIEIQARLGMNPAPCINTLSKWLHNACITVKNVVNSPEERNSEEAIEQRRQWAEWRETLSRQPQQPDLVYIDEIGVNLWTRVLRGRSRQGTPCVQTIPTQRGVNVSCISAISEAFGYIYHRTSPLSTTALDFESFMFDLIREWNKRKQPGGPPFAIFILDNASVHSKTNLPELLMGTPHQLHFLPKYSPFLNPIESVNAKHKSLIRKMTTERTEEFLAIDKGQYGQRQKRKTDLLQAIISACWQQMDATPLGPYFLHCEGFLVACALGHHIEGEGGEMRF